MLKKMKPPEKLIKIIHRNSTFLITSHINPEGDAIGSELTLTLALERLGKKVEIWNRHPVPEIYRFLPHSKRIRYGGKIDKRYDVLLLLDCGNFERTGLIERYNPPGNEVFVIDHHRTESPIKDKGWIEPDASSTGEMVYNLIVSLGIEIDLDIAVNLYTAIMTDTGSFRYTSTTPEALRIAGILVEKGVRPWQINEEVYENLPFRKLRLFGYALRTLDRNKDRKVAWMTISQRMFRLTKTGAEDTEEFVNYLRSIKGVEVAILFRQTAPKAFKLSFRSRGMVDVAKIAESLGGGGHSNASGCELKGNLSEIRERVVGLVEKAIAMHKLKIKNQI
jgi:phosphoesterase RecJ-like protein